MLVEIDAKVPKNETYHQINPLNEAKVRELWNSNAAEWSRGVAQHWDFFRWTFHDPNFFPLIPDVSDRRVLDLGCGEGVVTRRFAEAGALVTGVDISDQLIAIAHTNTPPRLGVKYLNTSISDLSDLPDASFDIAVCIMTLMDTPSLEAIFLEAARVLCPGGVLAISVTHPFWDRKGTQWVDNEKKVTILQPGDYFSQNGWIDEWSFRAPVGEAVQSRPFQIATFPHTLSDYFNAAVNAGFNLHYVKEPRPAPTGNPEIDAVLSRWQKVPFYLMASFLR